MISLKSGDWITPDLARRVGWISLTISLAMLATLLGTAQGTLDAYGRPLGTDFSGVWTAGQMALEGKAPDAWNWSAHHVAQEALHGSREEFFGWHYPPPFLILASILATMPYLWAWPIWQFASLSACICLIRKIIPGPDTVLLALAAPVTLICITHGHNGFLTAGLLGSGLFLLDRRPLVAGMLFGCLIYKPQFALLIGPLILATRNWRALLGGVLSSSALVLATLAIWGWPVWAAFIESLPLTQRIIIESGATGFHKIMSPFAAARMWGSSVATAYLFQTALTLAAVAGALACTLFSSPAIRNAAICAAAMISTPYVMDYDLVVIGVGIAFFVSDARARGWLPFEKSALAAIWFIPLTARSFAMTVGLPLGLLSTMLLLLLACRRTWACVRAGTAPVGA